MYDLSGLRVKVKVKLTVSNFSVLGIVRLKRDGTQLREEGGLEGKQANGVGTI
jgi:hypothetical protein